MSPDEVLVLIGCLVVGALVWGSWYRQALRVAPLVRRSASASIPDMAPLLSLGVLFSVLMRFASSDVRESGIYLLFYCLMGVAWLGLSVLLLPILGLSRRDDVLERGNAAAGWAVGGAMLGITLCFAGGNIGDGPGWWVVAFCAALSTLGLLLLWVCLDLITGAADAISVERDVASGIRAAGFFVGAGLILGRAVAGDWTTAGAAARDFLTVGWPACIVLAVAAAGQRVLRPTASQPQRPPLTAGLLPGLAFVALGVLILSVLGWWK